VQPAKWSIGGAGETRESEETGKLTKSQVPSLAEIPILSHTQIQDMSSPSRRSFLARTALSAGGFLSAGVSSFSRPLQDLLNEITYHEAGETLSSDEDFWGLIRQAYTVSPNVINLNNGGVSPQPRVVQEAVERYNRLSNEAPSYYMWRILDQGREPMRRKLADIAGCSPDEIAVQRNSSESLETVIFGLPLQRGDEVVLTRQDYPNMINAWKQREARDGIVLRWLNFEFPIENADTIVQQFASAFTPRTKLVHVTHMINWNGQILPVRQIARAAHARGIEVLVDGAHTFAHLNFRIPDLECDYFGTSLHKWLCAPFGSGMLYIKRNKIQSVWPLLAAPEPNTDDIRKFEHLGTRSFAIEQAIGQAVDFHTLIGAQRKQDRLQYLKHYWTSRALEIPGVRIGTSLKPDWGCAIGLLQIEGKEPLEIGSFLFDTRKVHTVAINWENIHGVRITPHVYTTTRDLDVLLDGILELAAG
jgi:selenocysteine lyase/cysteine desulfurase